MLRVIKSLMESRISSAHVLLSGSRKNDHSHARADHSRFFLFIQVKCMADISLPTVHEMTESRKYAPMCRNLTL